MKISKTPIEDYMRKKRIDLNARVDCDNGGIYLHNLLQDFSKEVRDNTLIEITKEIRSKVSWVESK